MPKSKLVKFGEVLLSALGGAATGFALGGPLGAAGGAVVAGGGKYATLAPTEQEKLQKLAQKVEKLRAKGTLNKKDQVELKAIIKAHPELAQEKYSQVYSNPTPDNLAKLQGSEEAGYPAQELRFQRFTPEQQAGMSSVLQNSLGQLGKNQFDFAPIEAKARNDFAKKTIPSIAERFTQLGAQKSSAFPQLLSQAGKDLDTELGALGAQYNLSREQNLHRLLGIGLTPQYESTFFAGQPGTGNRNGSAKNWGEALTNKENIDLFKQGFGAAKDWWKDMQANKEYAAEQQKKEDETRATGFQPQFSTPGAYNPSAPNTSSMQGMYPQMNQNPFAPQQDLLAAAPAAESGFNPPAQEGGSYLKRLFGGY